MIQFLLHDLDQEPTRGAGSSKLDLDTGRPRRGSMAGKESMLTTRRSTLLSLERPVRPMLDLREAASSKRGGISQVATVCM